MPGGSLVSQKIGERSKLRPSYTTPGPIKRCSIKPQGYLLSYVHGSFIQNSQTQVTTQMLLN